MKTFAFILVCTLCAMSARSETSSNACVPIKSESTTETAAGPERWLLTIEWSDLAAGPQWQPGRGEVPLSPAKAMALAAASFGIDIEKFQFPVVYLLSTTCGKAGPYWYYSLQMIFQDFPPEGTLGPAFAVVLLNGKVIRMTRAEDGSNKTIEPTR